MSSDCSSILFRRDFRTAYEMDDELRSHLKRTAMKYLGTAANKIYAYARFLAGLYFFTINQSFIGNVTTM